MRLKTITIEGFRGFNQQQTVSLDAEVVLVLGDNGSGKSSVTEALEWVFFGHTSRELTARSKQDYGGTHVRNVHYGGDNPSVAVAFELNAREHVACKVYINANTQQRYLDGQPVDDFASLGVDLSPHARPVLGQAEIRALVDTPRGERYKQVADILGLGEIGQTIQDLRALRTAKPKDPLVAQRLEALERTSKQCQEVGLDEVAHALSKPPVSAEALVPAVRTALQGNAGASADELAGQLDACIASLLKPSQQPKAVADLFPAKPRLNEEALVNADRSSKSALRCLRSRSAPTAPLEFVKFKRQGLKLAPEGETCPMCDEPTLTQGKRKNLQTIVDKNLEALKQEEGLTSECRDINAFLDSLEADLLAGLPGDGQLRLAIEQTQDEPRFAEHCKELGGLLTQRDELAEKAPLIRAAAGGWWQTVSPAVSSHEYPLPESCDSVWAKVMAKVREHVASAAKLDDDVQEVRERIRQAAPGLSDSSQVLVDRYQCLRKVLGDRLSLASAAHCQELLTKVDAMVRQLSAFERAKLTQATNRLSQEVKTVYEKLNPSESIVFQQAAVAPGTQKSISLVADFGGKELNPVSQFSEAHSNSLGIALYVSQRVTSNPTWGFMLFDDPVQSMDVQHSTSLGFLLQELAEQKQLIVMTHQPSFFEKLRELFSGGSLLCYEMYGFGEGGPLLEQRQGPIRASIEQADRFKSGNEESRRSAGNSLRCAMEGVCRRYLVEKAGKSRRQVQRLSLDGLLTEMGKANFNQKYLKRMCSQCQDLNRSSHYSSSPVSMTAGQLETVIQLVEEVIGKYDVL